MVLTERLSDHVREGVEAFLFFGEDAVAGLREALGDRYAGVLNLAWGYSETFPAYLNIVNAAADKGGGGGGGAWRRRRVIGDEGCRHLARLAGESSALRNGTLVDAMIHDGLWEA